MANGSVSGHDVPSNEGFGPGGVAFVSTDEAERLVPLGTETSTVAVKALEDNEGVIYVGYTDDVDSSNGFPLSAGQGVSFDLDANQQGIFAAADTVGDEVRWIALG